MEKHITLVGALYIGFGILGMIASFIIFAALTFAGVMSGNMQAFSILSVIAFAVITLIVIFSALDIFCGIGLLRRKSWARMLGLILAVLSLFHIPIGTAKGIYSIWVLIHDDTVRLFNREI
ncbi:MAG: hypothetical protein JXB48_07925 [Candidatus Latescibacteria bacterium]|nr:hypothetical protein [Candidatus Latescibacterota bacterium]